MFLLLVILLFQQIGQIIPQGVDREIGTMNALIGGSVKLQCDLRNIYDQYIIWYHNDHGGRYISYGENFFGDVPDQIKQRMSIVCDKTHESCSLTITNLTMNDNGTYTCGYGLYPQVNFLTTGTLKLSYGTPPSKDSPHCAVFISQNGYYIPQDSDVKYSVGESIFLHCSVVGGSPKPLIYWKRNGVAIGLSASGPAMAHEYLLTQEDIGVMFTCVMTHALLNESRSCFLIPLPSAVPNSTPSSIVSSKVSTLTPIYSEVSPLISSSAEKNVTLMATTAENSFLLPASIIGIMAVLIIMMIVIIIVFIWRRNSRKSVIPRRPDYNVTFDRRDCSITPDYAAVNAADSIDKMLEQRLSDSDRVQSENHSLTLPSPGPNSSPIVLNNHAVKRDNFPIYAKPDKKQKRTNGIPGISNLKSATLYHNLPCDTTGDDFSDEYSSPDKEGLTYAELDLPVITRNEFPRKQRTNRDGTIYARIEGTL